MPHFEKMLYDNAQLLELLALAYQRSGNPLFRSRARETVAWLAREMTTAEGAFCASLDADSEGEEGKFYVWSLAEIETVLGADDAAFFAAALRRDRRRQFRGPQYPQSPQALTAQHGGRENGSRRCATSCLRLAPARVRPGLDDKVLADWNGLMIAALVNAGITFERAALARDGRARLPVHRCQDDPRRPARPFLAGRAGCCSPASPPILPP